MFVRLSCLQVLASLLLACFVTAKAVFWLGLLSVGAEGNNPFASHPCACSGTPVCACVSENCCELAPTGVASQNGWQSQIQARDLCGGLSAGGGVPFGEIAAIASFSDACRLLPWDSRPVPLVVVKLPDGRTDCPPSPPPKA